MNDLMIMFFVVAGILSCLKSGFVMIIRIYNRSQKRQMEIREAESLRKFRRFYGI